MDIASHVVLFASVVEHGSFSATARSLGLSPSAVSKQIGQLEDRLGVRLLNRSTRSITLTEEGRIFHQRCSEIASKISEAESLIVSLGGRAQGTLRVAATVAFGKAQLLPVLPAFLRAHPDLRVTLQLTDQPVDLVDSEIDVAIRFSEQIDDDSVVARKLASNNRVICASPDYVRAHGLPASPEALEGHNCLRLSTVARWNDWEFDGPEGKRVLQVSGNFEADSADAVYHAVLAGLGLARLSTYLVGRDLQSGRLVRVLPDYVDRSSDILAIYSNRRNLSPKVRVFIDYLAQHFGPVPPWEREAQAESLAV